MLTRPADQTYTELVDQRIFGGTMLRSLGVILLLAAVPLAWAGNRHRVPEINAGSATSALALLSGTLLIVRGRSQKQK